ncbi:MAG: MerR family transcriptional regulator [Nocardioides sp.]|nr:MerR family transcriptional regulator [Nocardioides sp.]
MSAGTAASSADPGDPTGPGQAGDDGETGLLTIDELAAAVGLTVRTTRYYASLGLIPPPVRRGRMAYYDDAHRGRLELVRALQDHGFTLQAVERFLGSLPPDAGAEDLALQRAMLTSWSATPSEPLTRRQVEKQAGRPLRDDDLALLVAMGALDPRGPGGPGASADEQRWVPNPSLRVGVELLDLDVPHSSLTAASEAITRHMDDLAGELTDVLRTQVLEPFRREPHSRDDAVALERTMARLRQLTLEAVVAGFQRAANAVITRSLTSEPEPTAKERDSHDEHHDQPLGGPAEPG